MIAALVSLPLVWTLIGLGFSSVFSNEVGNSSADESKKTAQLACRTPEAFQALANEPKGVVSSPSNFGASVLRFTHHRAIAAPYHRNQAGLLAEIKSSLADPAEAEAILKAEILEQLNALPEGTDVALKLTIPTEAGIYDELADHPAVDRRAAASCSGARDGPITAHVAARRADVWAGRGRDVGRRSRTAGAVGGGDRDSHGYA